MGRTVHRLPLSYGLFGPPHFSEAFADPHALLQKPAQYRLEGIVSKRVDLPYLSGKRPE